MRRSQVSIRTAMLSIILCVSRAGAEDGASPTADNTSQTGSLVGRFAYSGDPPAPARLAIPLRNRVLRDGIGFDTEELPGRRRLQQQGVPDESLVVSDDGGIANVLVWITSENIPVPPPHDLPPPVTVRAESIRFKPRVLAFWNASPLECVNESGVGIDFSCAYFASNRVLADGQRTEYHVSVLMPHQPQQLRSHRRPWLQSYLLALPHPYFSVSGTDGRFKIDDVPTGEWEFAIWHERSSWLATDKYPRGRFKLQVKSGHVDLGDLKVAGANFELRPQPPQEPPPEPLQPQAFSPRTTLSDLHTAAIRGQSQRVVMLLAAGEKPNDREPRFNGTPLHYAARHGHSKVVQVLIDRGARVDARDTNDCTPLVWAIKGGHAEIARQLLDANANPDLSDTRGWSALHYAYAHGLSDTAQLLIGRGADVQARNCDGKTPLDLKPDIAVSTE